MPCTLPVLGPAVAVAYIAGCGAALLAPRFMPWPLLLLGLPIAAWMWWRGRHWRLPGALLFGLAWCSAQALWVLAGQWPAAADATVVDVRGVVSGLPQPDPRGVRFGFEVEQLTPPVGSAPMLRHGARLRLTWYDAPGKGQWAPRLQPGERWQLRVKLRAPRGLRNPGAADAERYALADRSVASGYVRDPATARRLSSAAGVDAWRARMSARIARNTPVSAARFVQALALGDTRALTDADWDTLRATGLTHLIAISGFHVGLVAGAVALLARVLWWALPGLGRRWPQPLAVGAAGLLGAIGYAALAGFALPTVRTVLMIAVVVLARQSRRNASMAEVLALALLVMLLADPLALLAAGFWLSFAGVAWLAWCLPGQGGGRLAEFLHAQGVATLGLLPLTIVLFGQASLAGPFANLLAVPWWSLVVVPLALLGSGLEAVHNGWGAWAWQLAAWCFAPSWWLFERLAASGLAEWWPARGPWFALPLALLGAFWWLLPRGVPGKALAGVLWLPLLWPDTHRPAAGDVELVVFDVGQGMSVLLRTQHHALLYDTGPRVPEGFDAGERAVLPGLRALGVQALDAVMVSHADADHAGGDAAIRRVMPEAWRLAPAGSGVADTRACLAGMHWVWDGVRFDVLHPTAHFPYLGNQAGCVLRVETASGRVALLPADIGEVIERTLVARVPAQLRADVVLVAHHGSASSSDPAFIAATRARFAVVSTGHGNRFRHPLPDIVARWRAAGAHWHDTAEGGALRIGMSAAGVTVADERTLRQRPWDAARRARAARAGTDSVPVEVHALAP